MEAAAGDWAVVKAVGPVVKEVDVVAAKEMVYRPSQRSY